MIITLFVVTVAVVGAAVGTVLFLRSNPAKAAKINASVGIVADAVSQVQTGK